MPGDDDPSTAPGTPDRAPSTTFAVKLDRLFQTITNQGEEYTYNQVATECSDAGTKISHTYVWQLRKGKKTNPSLRHIEALAKFFQVPPAYFLDDDAHDKITAQLRLLGALRSRSIQDLALRADGLSARALYALAEMVESARAIEGLPHNPPPDPPPDNET